MAIDARENINAQIAIARNLGGDIGSALGYREREKNRRERMRERMELAQIQILADPNLTAAEKRQAMLMTSNLLQEGIGEDIEGEMLQKTLGLGRYYQDPLDTQYKKARIKDIESRTESRRGGLGFGSGAGTRVAGQGNLFGLLKTYQDGLRKAMDATLEGEDAESDPQVLWFRARIKEIQLKLNPPQVDQNWLQSQGPQEGGFQEPPAAPTDTRESLTTAEELIGRDDLMEGAFGKPGIAGPPASAQTKIPIPTPSLEKRSSAAKPKTKEEFLATVARMKASPETIERARTYYEKWVGEFKWQ